MIGSTRESDDDYYGVVVKLNEGWRVIDSREPGSTRQWILQQNRSRQTPNRWKGNAYMQHKDALLRMIGERVKGAISPAAMEIVVSLPARIGEGEQ